MKYYKFGFNFNLKEVGVQPQSSEIKLAEFNSEDLGFKGPIESPLYPPHPILKPRAKPTTFLNITAINYSRFLVFKDLFFDILKEHQIDEYQKWPIDITYRNELLHKYWLFYLIRTYEDQVVDFYESKFRIGKLSDWRYVGDSVHISDYENFCSLEEVLNQDNLILKAERLIIDFSNTNADLLRIASVPSSFNGYYLSEKLKNAIEDNNLTGISFQDVDQEDDRIVVSNY